MLRAEVSMTAKAGVLDFSYAFLEEEGEGEDSCWS